MKNKMLKLTILLVLMALIVPVISKDKKPALPSVKNFNLNPNVGPIELRFVSTAPLEEIKGSVKPELISSNVTFDPQNIEKTNGKITFKVVNLATGMENMEKHLYSNEWLDAPKYPDITFELSELKNAVAKPGDGGKLIADAKAIGTFNMHGTMKQIEIPVKITFIKESDATKKRAQGDLLFVEGAFDISLKDFNIKGRSGLIGKKVGEVINISLKLFYNVQ